MDVEEAGELPELLGEVLAFVVWFLFGAVLVPLAFTHFEVSVLVYALLSLTVVRMLPLALSVVGAGLDRQTVLFLGWFGPRGLASVVFALLAVEELGETVGRRTCTGGRLPHRVAQRRAPRSHGRAPGESICTLRA